MAFFYSAQFKFDYFHSRGGESMLLSVTRKSLVFVWFLSLFLLGSFTYAQSTVNYNYSTATNASLTDMSTGATSLLAAGVDDTPSSVTNIGFNFVLMGVPYSQFSLTENGIMRLGSTAMVSNTYAIPNSTIPTLAPFGNDMRVGTDGSVVYKVLGTAPSRVLVVQWKKIMIRYLGTAAAGTATFEARLYESTGVIEYVYGEMATNTASPASYYIGFSVNTTANNLISVNTTDHSVSRSAATANTYTASSTVAPLHSTSDGSRRIYTFTPPTAPSAPSNLTFTSVGAGSMTLNWTDNSSNELGFSIARSTDGVNYSVVGSVGANVATYNATNLTPNTTYYWAVQAYSEGAMSSVLTASQTTNPPGNFVSAASGNWNVAATWTNNMVPSASDNVTIADGHTVVIDAASTCLNLTVGQGTSGILRFGTTATNFTVNGNLTVSANGTFDAGATGGASLSHTLYIGGSSATANTSSNVVINGTFKMYIGSSNGKAAVTFFGANNSTVSGTGTTMDFYQVILNKGATTATSSVTPPILELQRAFTVQGSASTTALATTFTAGVLKISGTFNQSNAIFSSTSYSIPALGGIWLNNPNFTITGLGGSPTNNGLVRVSNGKYIIGTSTGQSMSGGSSSVFIIDSGTVNVAGRLTMASSGTYYSQTGGTVVVQMSGNAASSNPGFSMSSSSGTTFAMSGGSIVLQLASTGSTQQDYNVAPATVNITGGTLQLGNASSGTAKTFKIMGNTPNLIVDSSSAGHTANLAGNLIVNGDILVKTGATLTNGLIYSLTVKGLSSSYPGNILNRGTMTFNQSSSQYLIFNSSFGDQTVTNNGTITANQMGNVDINNTATNGKVYFPNGVSIANTGSSAANLKLTAGTLVATSLTLGGGSSSTAMFTCTRTAGTLQNAPSFAFGSGSVNYIYNGSAAQVTGNELPASISNNLTINNANGVTLNSPFSTAILTLTNGILTTTATNLLTVTGAYVGGVARTSGYVNGPMVRTLPGAMATGSTYLFPVGKSAYTPVELVNPTTSGISSNTVQVLAEVFDASSQGTAGTGLSALNTNRYWNTAFVGASTYFTNATLRVTETAAIDPQAGLGQNTTGSANGVYNLIGSTISGSTIASSTVTTLGYLNIGTKSVPMAYSSSTTTQPSTQPVPQQSTSQAVIQVQVVTTGNASPLNVSKFTVNANGTTSASDITNARIYYTGTSSTFATTTQFGSTVASPTIANYTISGSQNLVEGTNYFWLTYDIPTAAVIGDSVDAECSLITINGTDYTPTVTAPAGKRAVKNVLTVGTGVLTQAYPMHRNYNYSTWEGIYLQSEVGTAKVISKIGFTKSSGTDVTGIQSVQVYLKHTSGSTLAAGQYSLSGYTQVFNGSFTNNAASGLMEVSLDKSFYYNGTDNLQVLIVKGNQAYISTYPYYYATSVATTRVRQAGSDSYQPGTGGSAPDLATTTYLPNLTLTYSIPTPMTFVSAANTQALSGTEVSLGSANQQIIGVKVVTSGQMSPLTASAFSFNTGSSSDPATDLVNAKLFYTGNSSTFATTQQIGDAFVSPNADFAISSGSGLPVTLQSDTNYFWLTYDISSGATRGDIVDALCNAVTISSADQPVAPHAGAGRTIVAPLAGTYNVGSGSKYTTIASAINALKTFGVSGAVTFLLKDATYPSETFPITIDSISGANSTNTVTFKPSTGVSTVISGSSATAIIKINGADYVTIDGSNTAKGTDRSLTITNTNSAGAAVMLASNGTTRGATYNTIKNCVISTGSHIASGTYGIFLGGSTIGVAGDDNDNNTISNNVIKNARYGIYSYASSTGNNDNITVSDNIIGDADTAQTFGTYGIYVTYLNSSTITRNTIFGASNAIGYIYGIYATGSLTNTTISKNKIYGLKYVGTGGYSGAGMYISSVASSNVSLIN
ncbi:MAG: fibronectin type III domain-containing protein, partial [Ignavibacteria bacterium]|nr:fibronectin type III domain-containing protein [Ignavibacteria bacterium]